MKVRPTGASVVCGGARSGAGAALRPVLVGIGMVYFALAAATVTSGQGLGLGVSASQDLYYPGDRLELSISASNTGMPAVADFYTGVILPDGITIATVGPGGSARLGTLATPAAFVPVATNVSLAGPFSVAVDPLFQYVWTGTEPVGDYTIFLVAVRAGGFADNRIDGGDILAVQMGGLHVRARAEFTVEPGGGVAVPITPEEGGTVAVTSAAGRTFTLTVPPGAVGAETTITATPIASATGLPLDRLIGAVRFEPDGLRLQVPAILTVTLPPSLLPLGTVGFTAKDDGTGFQTIPVTITDDVATMHIAHFSTPGFGQSMCGPAVTSAVGRDACREMAEDLDIAADRMATGAAWEPGVRTTLAANLTTELSRWLNGVASLLNERGISPESEYYYFRVGIRELYAISAILQLVGELNGNPVLAGEIAFIETLLAVRIDQIRDLANAQCLVDKANYRLWLKRLFELADISHQRNLPVAGDTQGIKCIVLSVIPELATIVPPEGAPFKGAAHLQFADGGFLPDAPLVSIEIVENGLALLGAPTFAQAASQVELVTTVAPRENAIGGLQFLVRGRVDELGLAKDVTVKRGHAVAVRSQVVTYTFALRAGPRTAQFTRTNASTLDVPSFQLESELGSDADVGRSTARIESIRSPRMISGGGSSRVSAESTNAAAESTRSSVVLASQLAANVVGTFTCTFFASVNLEESASQSGTSASASAVIRVRRNGVVVFQTSVTGTQEKECDDGSYTIGAEMSLLGTSSNTSSGSASGAFTFSLLFTPKETPPTP